MTTKLSSFPPHPSILSPLLKKAPDAVPPTDELEQLYKELKLAKEKALERSKKANDDLKTIEESIRRMAEKEKGKFKAIDKIKRERDCTYMLLINEFQKKCLTCGLCMHMLTFHLLETTLFLALSIPCHLSMQTLLFPMPPTPKAQPLCTDNHQNRVLTLILSTLYLARLQDRRWTLVDRELFVL